MAHKRENDLILVDWKTGDKKGDRAYLFKAYRNFLRDLTQHLIEADDIDGLNLFRKWKIEELDVDDFPCISIKYPDDFPEELK